MSNPAGKNACAAGLILLAKDYYGKK